MRALLLVSLAVLIPGCPAGEECGFGDAAGDGLVVSGSGVSIRYHDMVASPNNDCPEVGAPDGVVSLTLQGVQVAGADAINLCVPRPDLLVADLPLVPSVPTNHQPMTVEIVDLNAAANGCTFVRNTQTPPSGVARAEGLCDNGLDPAGFALIVTGQVSVDRDCSGTIDTLRLDIAGTISIATP